MKKQAIFTKNLKNNIIQCRTCNHYCILKNNEVWRCWIRQNIDGKLYLLVYNKPLWTNIDPIEKKPLFHFLPWTEIFSFWTAGCNFECDFCQNYSISQIKKENVKKIEKQSKQLTPENIVNYCKKEKIPSIAYTYNEPTVFFEYAYDTMLLAQKNWIKNVFVSNWYFSEETREQLKNTLDWINIDLKSFSNKFYKNICKASLNPVLENIKNIWKKSNILLEITTLLIPWKNDSYQEIKDITQFIKNINPQIPWHISAFFPCYKMADFPITSMELLEKAYKIWKESWLKHIYIGNVTDKTFQSTFCPWCWEELIQRNSYKTITKYKQWGYCQKCWEKINLKLN